MPLNPEDHKDIRLLRRAMDHSRTRMGPFRRERISAMAQYAGKHYGPNSDTGSGVDRIPVNKIELMVDIFGRQLAANNPAVLVSTSFDQLLPMAFSFQIRLNRLIKELELVDTLREAVTDATFCLGVIRTGQSLINPTESGFTTERSGPYARSVSLDDFVIDMRAHRFDEVDFVGNRYRLPLDELRESQLYDEEDLEKLVTTEPNEGSGLGESTQRDLSLSLGTSVEQGEYRRYVDLWDVWLPSLNVIVTLPDKGTERALRIAPFDGPEGGPYHILPFGKVPGNLMPKSPAMAAMDLHLFVNAAYRKIFRQAERQKEIPWYRGEAAEDMQRLIDASDGQVVRVDNANSTGTFKSGGADPQGISIAIHAARLFNQQLGNLDLLGGLGTAAGTLGQEELLAGNANKMIADMQDRFVSFTKGVVQHLAWYEWTDPLREDIITKRIGSDDIRELWSQETREGDFVQYDIDVEPYSMQHHSPATRLQKLLQIYQQVLAPSAPMMQQQGIGIDWSKFMDLIQRYSNLPELGDVLTPLTEDQIEQGRLGSDRPKQSPVTERINTRVNRTQGRDPDEELMSKMMNASFGETQVA